MIQTDNKNKANRTQTTKQDKALAEATLDRLVDDIVTGGHLGVKSPKGSPKPHRSIKLGVDVHLDRYVVVRQIDGGAPQPPQRFSPAQFLEWAKKQTELAEQVYSCYEAGPFGYSLHRKLAALGITNYVVRPRDWDEYGKQVKTDKRDAKALVLHLDRYVAGNRDAFCVVRMPTEAQEQARSRSRQRESLQKEKLRLAAQGRSDALYYGYHLEGEWWVQGTWKELVLPPFLVELLEPLRRLIQAIETELQAQSKAITATAPATLPMGLGKLTYEVLEREICDWSRFQNRRQVASYTGMCPKEDSSDHRRFQGSINKHGNPRVRSVLVEASWRLVQFQPTYKPVAKWRPVLANPKTTKAKRKQIVVAIGRQFSVDWWRVRTQRCSAEDLGLKSKPTPASVPPTPRAKASPAQEK
jgi:transposase